MVAGGTKNKQTITNNKKISLPFSAFSLIILNWKLHSFFFFFSNLFIYFCLCWVFVSVRGLSLVVASEGRSSSRCRGLSLSRPLLLRSTGSRSAGSVIVAQGPNCSAACGIFPDQGSNPCSLHWQADSEPLRHQGSPKLHSCYYSLHSAYSAIPFWQREVSRIFPW